MRITISSAVDPDTLATQLTASLGVPVAVSTRDPGQTDDQGSLLPGVVVLLDPATGQELTNQDQGKINLVLAAHVPPVVKTPHRALADALGTAGNLQELRAALSAFAGKVATGEDRERQRRRRRHGGGGV